MKLNKDQRNAVIEKLNSIAAEKRNRLHAKCEKEKAKLPDPFVQFLEKVARTGVSAQSLCKALAAHIKEFIEGQTPDERGKTLYDAVFVVPVRNRAAVDYDAENHIWYNATSTPPFNCPELGEFIDARNAKLDAIKEKWSKREAALNAKQAELTLRIKLMDVPEELLKLLDSFEKTKF